MTNSDVVQICKACGASGGGNYCSQCGRVFVVKRITLAALLHDVFHFFTHLDKGFGFTLKRLLTAPGTMQQDYVEGDRSRYQQPFSMFFICATVAALSRYWINLALVHYHHAGNMQEANFFHQYMVLLHIALLPLYSFITYLFFRNTRYNFGELVVLLLYTFSFFFLTVSVIALLKFIWHDLDTAYVELPLLALYNLITFNRFFTDGKRWLILLKSLAVIVLLFTAARYFESVMIRLLH